MNQPSRRIRIGIDVGGTFTHAVALDTAQFDLIATVKVPTTHRDPRGVAAGIVDSLFQLMQTGNIQPDEITMIAHSTTQATNALLEGDVARIGIIGMAGGLGKRRARNQTRIGAIELAPGRFLHTLHAFIDTTKELTQNKVAETVDRLKADGAEVIVASAAFSVDDPRQEVMVADYCRSRGIQVTMGSEISQLYGLRARTRTAVINASMLPRMLETANMTESSVREAGINSPLMIMRSDGGIMDIEQMRRRPILTMLSGPAAGVAAAMMYAGITDGIFMEVGGTSTDISAIRNGKSQVRSATVGGHRLYLRTLDVRTLGVAGGSIPRIEGGKVIHVGPRSAHIANVHYAVFEDHLPEGKVTVECFQPKEGDPADYIRMAAPNHSTFSVTPTCASHVLGLTNSGNRESARTAFNALAGFLNRDDSTGVANELLTRGTDQVEKTVREMMEDYELDPQLVTLTGGGGGAEAIVPFTAQRMNLPFEIAKNAAVISAIGAALALVRDSVEKTIINPTDADVLKIRKEAEESVLRMGASAETIEVQIEIDAQKNIVRATATGTTELRTKEPGKAQPDHDKLEEKVRLSIRGQIQTLQVVADLGPQLIFRGQTSEKRMAGLWTSKKDQYRVIDREGIIRLQLTNGDCISATKRQVLNGLKDFFEKHTVYGDAGREHPDLFILFGGRILDMSGLINIDQILSLLQIDLSSVTDDEPVAVLLRKL